MDSGSLQKAISIFKAGYTIAESEEKKERMKNLLNEAETRMKAGREHAAPEEETVPVPDEDVQQVAQDDQQAEHEAERHAKELLAEEDVRITAESKRKAEEEEMSKGKQLSMVKKAVEVADESDRKVLEEKKEDKGSGSNLVKEREPPEFELTMSVTMEDLDGISFMGSTMINNTAKVKKSFIVAEPSHIDNIQELVSLCLTHDNLLKIDQGFKTLKGSLMLLSSEDVCSIECFFRRELHKIAPQSQESWWESIKDMFWKIFRDVTRGLMHLFVKGESCGDLVFNAFVTSKSEGRIVPSMKKVKQQEDLKGLVDLMQTVIKLPFPHQSDLFFLPYQLKHFFKLIAEFNASVPLEFLIDHPYFWNVAEKIDFTFKLRNLVKRTTTPFYSTLRALSYFKTWKNDLSGVYHSVLMEASKRKKTKAYKQNVDIVRYLCAVYTHINEYEYKAARGYKTFSDEKIESDLANIFPDFYINMFRCLCFCFHNGHLFYADLKGVSPVLSHVPEVPEEEIV